MSAARARDTIYRVLPIEQRSPEWLAFRAGAIGSSDAPTLVGANPYGDTERKMFDRKVGNAPELYAHPGMVKGIELEPAARACWERMTGKSWEPVVVLSERFPFAFASLDGASGDEDCEYKTYIWGSEEHELYRQGKVPAYDFAQAQHRFLVRGAKVCHCCWYAPPYGIVGEEMITVDVYPDGAFMDRLLEAERRFMVYLETGEEPALTDKDEVYLFDDAAVTLATQYAEWAAAEKAAKVQKDGLRDQLAAIVQATHPRVRFGSTGVLATFTVVAGSIDAKAVLRDFLASDERVLRYQRPGKPVLRIYCPSMEGEA